MNEDNKLLPWLPELTFEEQYHTYRLNGVYIPAVSTLLKPLSEAEYKGVDEDILNKAASRGTAVHQAIENYALFGIVDIPPEYEGYFNAFRNWFDKVQPEVLGTEVKIYNKLLRYAGTVDMPVKIDGKTIIIDFKTSQKINEMLTGVQLEAYAKAFRSHDIQIDGKAILHLQNDGNYEYRYYDLNDSESRDTLYALIQIYNHIQKYKK